MDKDELKGRVQKFMGTTNINDYNTIPTTPYRVFVDKIQERIAFVNGKPFSDDVRLELLKGALLSLLEINPDDIMTSNDKEILGRNFCEDD